MKRICDRLRTFADDLDKNLIKRVYSYNSDYTPPSKDQDASFLITKKGIEVFTEIGNYLDKMEKLLRDFLGTEEIVRGAVKAGIKLKYNEEIIFTSRLPEIKKVDEN